MKLVILLVTLVFCTTQTLSGGSTKGSNSGNCEDLTEDDHGHHGIALASWRWDEYSDLFVLCLMVIMAAVAKVAFHEVHYLSKHFPESCVLIILGIVVGCCVYFGLDKDGHHFPEFTSSLFFNTLLPPIILDSAYSLYDRDFVYNLAAIVQLAVFGTLFNVFATGAGLYAFNAWGIMGTYPTDLTIIQCFIFSSLISAVDPVAVLAIFDEIGVNKNLYFLVFGESLFNDGVTVVLYNTMVTLSHSDNVGVAEYGMAFLSFFFVVFGGLLIGIICGAFSAYFTKFTQHTRVVEPLVIWTSAYFSFIFAETIHWSGIISLIGCGIAQKRYAFTNISPQSLTTVNAGVKTLASISDVVIFLFLGVVTVSKDHTFHFEFTFWTVVLCIVFRFISIFVLSSFMNRRRTKNISKKEQFIMAYGGLRGAVGFSLVTILDDNNPLKEIFQTTTLIMIFITVFVMGSTVKPLVNILNIKKREKKEHLIAEDVNEKCIDIMMAGVESVVGKTISRYQVLNHIEKFDNTYLKKVLTIEGAEDPLTLSLHQISLDEHYARLYAPTMDAFAKSKASVEEEPKEPSAERQRHPTKPEIGRKTLKEGFNTNAFEQFNRVKIRGEGRTGAGQGNALEMQDLVQQRTQRMWKAAMRKSVAARSRSTLVVKEGDVEQGTLGPSQSPNLRDVASNVGERSELIKQAYRRLRADPAFKSSGASNLE